MTIIYDRSTIQRAYVKGGVREGSYEGEFHDGVRHGYCTAVADHLLFETKGCAAAGRVIVMSSDSVEAWDAQEWVVISSVPFIPPRTTRTVEHHYANTAL